MIENEQIKKIMLYWRNSLADTARMTIDEKKLEESGVRVTRDEIQNGQLNSTVTEIMFLKAIENKNKSGNKDGKLSLEVTLIPYKLNIKYEHGVEIDGLPRVIIPICISAVLTREGDLLPKKVASWIPRNYLEPTVQNSNLYPIGDVEGHDRFLTVNKREFKQWSEVWEFTSDLFETVTGNKINDFMLPEYLQDNHAYISLENSIKAIHILSLYDRILTGLKKEKYPALLQRYGSLNEQVIIPLLTEQDQLNLSIHHVGQMSNEFSLSPSQRETLHHFLTIGNGDILAVNGPPGTGKTTLLQSIVSTLWVKSAVEQSDPPIILAASTNNQAVTNVIDSFGKVNEKEFPYTDKSLFGRWIPDISSYGLYLPRSLSKDEQKTLSSKYHITDTYENHFPKKIEDESQINVKEEFFLAKLNVYSKQDIKDIHKAAEYLHSQLLDVISEIKVGTFAFHNLYEKKRQLIDKYGTSDMNLYVKELDQHIIDKKFRKTFILRTHQEWFQSIPFKMKWFSWIRYIRNELYIHNSLFFENCAIDINNENLSSCVKISNEIQAMLEILSSEIRQQEEHRSTALIDKQELEGLENFWNQWHGKYPYIKANFKEGFSIVQELDKTLRFNAFKLATHYWEARWLLEIKIKKTNQKGVYYSETLQIQKWRRYAKLTPCMVSTLHMTPQYFKAGDKPLFESIDLLIIDEAGQVSPEVAAPTFSLAKRSIIVGDVLQIEPVWNITKDIDIANLADSEIIDSTIAGAYNSVSEKGMCVSSGSVMMIAQKASYYQSHEDIRGMFLSEHRRCVPEIIRYCNELAYKGKLDPQTPKIKNYPLPHMGYADIKGIPMKKGGSRSNPVEAQAIVKWIIDNKQEIQKYYDEMNAQQGKDSLQIKDIFGIITPFAAQKFEIMKCLKNAGLDITAGTVHALQGAERQIVIFSPVYGEGDSNFFFDSGKNMLNVAVSRAKDSFLVFGNMEIFDSGSNNPSGILAKILFESTTNKIEL